MHKMVSWIELNYKLTMLIAMAIELILLGALVIIEVIK
jgi:hypothetical protein